MAAATAVDKTRSVKNVLTRGVTAATGVVKSTVVP
jgi:hypothetical protein